MKRKIFRMTPVPFMRMLCLRVKEAGIGIPKDLTHPHILRQPPRRTQAIELLKTGVSVTVAQDLLGLSALTTTAVYLRLTDQEAKSILKDKGFI
jgi:site-specific recombinase XerD